MHGPITFDSGELDDLIIARSDGTPTYNFCVVVDDYDMRVTHVIRGDDHINNTPRQINMLRALGVEPPVYAHVPMILGPDGAKLSKRHGAVSVLQYRDDGFLPEGLLNYLGRLGWSHGDQEIFTLDGDDAVLRHRGRQQVRVGAQPRQDAVDQPAAHPARDARAARATTCSRSSPRWVCQTRSDARSGAVARAQQERAKTLKEMARNSVFFFRDARSTTKRPSEKHLTAEAVPLLTAVRARLAGLETWQAAAIHEGIAAQAAEKGVALGQGRAADARRGVWRFGVAADRHHARDPRRETVTLERLDAAIELAKRAA